MMEELRELRQQLANMQGGGMHMGAAPAPAPAARARARGPSSKRGRGRGGRRGGRGGRGGRFYKYEDPTGDLGVPAPISSGGGIGGIDASGSVPLTMEEKRRLADGVHRLEQEQLSRVLSIIQEFVPVGAGNGG